jgi:hypothetical protein
VPSFEVAQNCSTTAWAASKRAGEALTFSTRPVAASAK